MFKKESNKRFFIISVVVAVVLILIIIKVIDKNYQNKNTQDISFSKMLTEENEKEKDEKIKVYITGEVNNQGVFELDAGSRIIDVIEKAGGQTDQADLKNVNLAYELEDGQKIYIPSVTENNLEDVQIIDDGAEGIVVDGGESGELVNINKATEAELQNLPGIGEGLANAIVRYRVENGNFESIEDLKAVPGIGESKFENIREMIKV